MPTNQNNKNFTYRSSCRYNLYEKKSIGPNIETTMPKDIQSKNLSPKRDTNEPSSDNDPIGGSSYGRNRNGFILRF